MPNSNRVSDHAKAGFNRACTDLAPEARWEMTMVPNPENGQIVLICAVWLPGLMVGTVAQAHFEMPNVLAITSKDAEEQMLDVLRNMREARSRALADETEQATAQVAQAGKVRASGLVLP